MKSIMQVCGLSVQTHGDNRRKIVVEAFMPSNVELDPDDLAQLVDVLNEAASRFEGGAEAAEEPEPEPASPRRRRGAAAEPEAEPEEKPAGRRRRGAAAAEEPKGPAVSDVAAAASKAAEELGPKVLAEIIGEFSKSGKMQDIPADQRQKFINTCRFELGEIGEDEIGD